MDHDALAGVCAEDADVAVTFGGAGLGNGGVEVSDEPHSVDGLGRAHEILLAQSHTNSSAHRRLPLSTRRQRDHAAPTAGRNFRVLVSPPARMDRHIMMCGGIREVVAT